MATLVFTLPDEATQKLRDIPGPLRLKIEAVARSKGQEELSVLVLMTSMLILGSENITRDPVELDILDELRLYFQAFNQTSGGLPIHEDNQGKARIAGTRIKVSQIAEEHTHFGMTPDQIVESHPHLSLAQVNAALAYYDSHRDTIDAQIAESLAYADQSRSQSGGSTLAARLHTPKVPLGIEESDTPA